MTKHSKPETKSSEEEPLEGPVWVPDEDETFIRGEVVGPIEGGKKYKVTLGNSDRTAIFEADKVQRCNPASFERCDDMASLTYLNEPSVVNTLKLRYFDNNIYTYSGLFLVAVNPYKAINIYNKEFVQMYKDSRKKVSAGGDDEEDESSSVINLRSVVKPHIFSIAEEAYQYLLRDSQDQSILVTGESGAGKTENTKKVIQYILSVSSSDKNHGTARKFEDQIMQANPILESFGNATTVRNLNSSRFGKFVKINALPATKELTGAHIDWYLLEKSRVVVQDEGERNYHAFYQLLRGAPTKTLLQLKLSRSTARYAYLQNDNVRSIRDDVEYENLDKAFNVMNFDPDDKLNVYKVLAIILHLGNITFRNKRGDTRPAIFSESSEPTLKTVAELLDVSADELQKAILTSKAKAGREVITQRRTGEQAKFAIDALAKSLYERLFQFLVDKINENFDGNQVFSMERSNYIGILDIAGFEIFKKNSFEQLCINYTNEKLQQFFNHHMFVLEQSEYLKEGISWRYIDFGHELKPTIELIEGTGQKRQCSIFSILNEECVVPKGTDQTFLEKLFHELECRDKSADKSKLCFKPNKVRGGFIVKHYAGEVDYSVDGWLDKNKDPLSSTLVSLLSNSQSTFVADMFESQDHLSTNLSNSPVRNQRPSARTGRFRTVVQRHKEQLSELMEQLSLTHPHFVRCILPNNNKAPGQFNTRLVLEQLRCNGVLEGIRIARSGYPNRITFEKFATHYAILASDTTSGSSSGGNFKNVCEKILNEMELDQDVYKVGLTKLFFRNGVLASIEKKKQAKLAATMTAFQSKLRGDMVRAQLKQKIAEYTASKILASNFKLYAKLAADPWFRLVLQMKPTLTDSGEVEKQYVAKIHELESKVAELADNVSRAEAAKVEASDKLSSMQDSVSGDRKLLADKDRTLESNQERIVQLEKEMQEKRERLAQLEEELEATEELQEEKDRLAQRVEELQTEADTQKEKHKSLTAQVSDLKSQIGAKEEEIESGRAELKGELAESRARVRELEREQRKVQDSLDAKDAIVSEFRGTVRSKESELKRVRGQLETLKAEVDKLKSESGSGKKEVEAAQKEVERSQSEAESAQTELKSAQKELVSVRKELESAQKELERAQSEVGEMKQSLGETKTDLDDAHATIASLQQTNKSTSEDLKKIQSKYRAVKQKWHDAKKHLENKIKADVDYDRGRPKYDKEMATLKEQLTGLQQELELEKRSSSRLSTQLRESKSENEKTLMLKKHTDVRLAEMNFKLSQKPQQGAHVVVSGDVKKLQDEMEMLQIRLAAESYENRQLRGTLKKNGIAYEGISSRVSSGSSSSSAASSTFSRHRPSASYGGRSSAASSIRSTSGSSVTSGGEEDTAELSLQKSANKRLEMLNMTLQKQLLQQKNRSRELHGLEPVKDDYETKYQLACMQLENLEERLKEVQGGASVGPDPMAQSVLRDSTRSMGNSENRRSSLLDSSSKESLLMRQENLRLSSRLNETQTRLKRLQVTSDSAFVQQEELAKLKNRVRIVGEKNESLQDSVNFYKERAENYYNKIEAAEVAVNAAQRARDMTMEELAQTKKQLNKAQDEFKNSDMSVARLNAQMRETERTLSDKMFELKRLQEQYAALKDKYEDSEKLRASTSTIQSHSRDKELQTLNADLVRSMNKETELGKQIKNVTMQLDVARRAQQTLKFSNGDLAKEKAMLNKVLGETTAKKDAAETRAKELSMRVSNLSSQVKALRTARDDLVKERDDLLESKRLLEKKVADISAEFEKHLKKVKRDASNAVNVVQLTAQLKQAKQQIGELEDKVVQHEQSVTDHQQRNDSLRDEALMVVEENKALTKYNLGLKAKMEDVQNKYEQELQTQEDHYTKRVQELEEKIYMHNATTRGDEQKVYDLQRQIKDLEQHRDMQATSLKRYTDQLEYLQQTVDRMESKISALQQKDAEGMLRLKRAQREAQDSKERALTLEKELLEWRSNGVAV